MQPNKGRNLVPQAWLYPHYASQTDSLMQVRTRLMMTSCDLRRSWIGSAQMKRWPFSKRWCGSCEQDSNIACLGQPGSQSAWPGGICVRKSWRSNAPITSALQRISHPFNVLCKQHQATTEVILVVVPYLHLCLGKTWGWRKGDIKDKHTRVYMEEKSHLPLYVSEYGKHCQRCH